MGPKRPHRKLEGEMKKIYILTSFILASLVFASCSNDTSQKKDNDSKSGQGIIEKKQHEIAQDAVKGMKDPIDKAKAVSVGEEMRNKDLKKASEE